MKKFLCLTLAAAALALPQHAYAWKNIQFGVGLNLSYQSGDNRLGKNFWYNGSGNGADPFGGPGYGGPGFGAPVDFAPAFAPAFPPAPQPLPPGPAPDAKSHSQATPVSPFHYSSYETGYYYPQTPTYYYGQSNWYPGW